MKKETIDTNSLAHSKWNCKYHIVFAPKYRRKVFYEEKKVRNTRNIAPAMPVERSRYNRRRSMSRPHTYAGKHPAQN